MSPGSLHGLDVRAPGEARSAVPGDTVPADPGLGICSPCPIRHPQALTNGPAPLSLPAPSTSLLTA